MATEAEIQNALDAGRRFIPAIIAVRYLLDSDQVAFETPWGQRVVQRADIELLRSVPMQSMRIIHASQVGVHIDDMDLDINSAGLLATLFPDLRPALVNSY